MSLQHLIDQATEHTKIELSPRMAYEGPIVIKKGIHIVGNLATLWMNTTEQPTLEIDTLQKVTLENMLIENVVNDHSTSSNASISINIKKMGDLTCQNVITKANINGISEDGLWNYPYVINLDKIKTNIEHKFRCKLFMPQDYEIFTDINDLQIIKKIVATNLYEVEFTLHQFVKEIIFRGSIYIKTNMFTRMIHFNANVSKDSEAKIYQNDIIFDCTSNTLAQVNQKLIVQKQSKSIFKQTDSPIFQTSTDKVYQFLTPSTTPSTPSALRNPEQIKSASLLSSNLKGSLFDKNLNTFNQNNVEENQTSISKQVITPISKIITPTNIEDHTIAPNAFPSKKNLQTTMTNQENSSQSSIPPQSISLSTPTQVKDLQISYHEHHSTINPSTQIDGSKNKNQMKNSIFAKKT